MRILVIGDVTSPSGVEHLSRKLWKFRELERVDFCVVNGENASFITGISEPVADKLLRGGADVITGGNHTLANHAAHTFLDDSSFVLRPINYGDGAPGRGYTIAEAQGYRILVISAMGNIHIEPVLDSPYRYIDKVLRDEAGRYDFSVLDFHAEATGEKVALAYDYDGKINVIFGTHTHVQTADEQILNGGTGYITDVGMCGESGGVLGMDPASVVMKMRTRIPNKYRAATGACIANGVVFTLDTSSGRVVDARRISF